MVLQKHIVVKFPEHCLSPLVKWAARLTQLRPSTIVEQSCERYYENHIIQRSVELLKHQNVIPIKHQESQLLTSLLQPVKTNSETSIFYYRKVQDIL